MHQSEVVIAVEHVCVTAATVNQWPFLVDGFEHHIQISLFCVILTFDVRHLVAV